MDITTILTQTTLAGNELWRIFTLFGFILGALVLGKILQHLCTKASDRLDREQKPVTGSIFEALSKSVMFPAFSIGFNLGLKFLALNPLAQEFADTISSVLLVLSVGWVLYWLVTVVDAWLIVLAGKTESKLDDMLAPMVRKSLRITIVILVLVQVAQVLSDKPITSILAGLGVGGLAVALAAQETLKNFFGSVALLSDRPFELGDRIVVDGHDGPVEEVGFRSTKIRTLEGHLVTVPNGELANKTIQNISKRPCIRRILNVGVTYDTPPDKVRRATDIIKELLKNHEGMDPESPPRVYFDSFKDSSLNIMAIYWYHPPEYWDFMTFSERLNMEILRRFNEERIEFAFPTQTLHIAKNSDQTA